MSNRELTQHTIVTDRSKAKAEPVRVEPNQTGPGVEPKQNETEPGGNETGTKPRNQDVNINPTSKTTRIGTEGKHAPFKMLH